MASVGVVGLDTEAVTGWIAGLGIDFSGPLSFDRIGLGQSNLTYLVRDQDGNRWVLRRPPLGHLLASAHDVAREARILSALESTDVPSPRVFGLTEDPAVTEVPLLLMEFVDGEVVDRMPLAEALSEDRRRAIGISLAQTLAKIHAVDLEQAGLDDLASHKPYAARQLKRWGGQWEQSKTRECPDLDDLTRRLIAAQPDHTETTLVHGDFHLRNVITSASLSRPSTGNCAHSVIRWRTSEACWRTGRRLVRIPAAISRRRHSRDSPRERRSPGSISRPPDGILLR